MCFGFHNVREYVYSGKSIKRDTRKKTGQQDEKKTTNLLVPA